MNDYDPDFLSEDRQNFWKNQGKRVYISNFKSGCNRREFIGKLMKKNMVSSVLEIGCNSCPNLMACYRHCGDIKLSGIDISERAINYAKNVIKFPGELHCGSLYDLSMFKDNSFDIVFSCTVLQHIPSEKVKSVLKEMIRISKYFVFVIEDHHIGEDKVYWCRKNVPQRWTTDYVEKFKSLNIDPVVAKMNDLITEKSVGGANYLIYINKANKNFVVDKLENL